MTRIIVGGFHHESNTFNPIVVEGDDITVLRGGEIFDNMSANSISGIVSELRKNNFEIIPILNCRAVPNGEWKLEEYMALKDEFFAKVEQSGDFYAFCLSLHGSMRIEKIGKAEDDFLTTLREKYPNKPVFASLDMHGIISDAMVEKLDGVVGYKTAPHVDEFETGEHVVRLMMQSLKTKMYMAACKLPILIAGEQSESTVEPMKSVCDKLYLSEKKEGIFASSYLIGYPWADCAENCVSAVVVANDEALAQREAVELAGYFWAIRKDFKFYNDTRSPEESLLYALETCKKEFPIVISDSGDNPTAGSSQDVTNFLQLILANQEVKTLDPHLIYCGFYDPEVASAAKSAGVGATIQCKIGGKFDHEKSKPVPCSAKVIAIYENWKYLTFLTDVILLEVDGVDVIITSKHVGCYDPEMMRVVGITPEQRKIIVVKLGYLEPELKAMAAKSVLALTDGSSNEILVNLPYKKVVHPIYPLDHDFEIELKAISRSTLNK